MMQKLIFLLIVLGTMNITSASESRVEIETTDVSESVKYWILESVN